MATTAPTTLTSDDFIAALTDLARRLSTIATDLGLRDVAQAIEDDRHRRIDQGRLRVAIIGEIKHGKSTLINALLGHDVLPAGVTPTTGALVSIRHGRETRRLRIPANPREEEVELDEGTFRELARGPKDSGDLSAPHDALRVEVSGSQLHGELELIDTPGLNDISKFRSLVSRDEFPRADVLVIVLDATQAMTKSELELLREALEAVGGLQRTGATLEVVINRIDLLGADDAATVVDHVATRLAEILPHRPTPFTTDARGALQDPSGESPGIRDVARLRERLSFLADSRETLLPARMRSGLLKHAHLLEYHAAIHARCVALDATTLESEIRAVDRAVVDDLLDEAALHQRINAMRNTLKEDFRASVAERFKALNERGATYLERADLHDLTDAFPGALRTGILEAALEESKRLRGSLDDFCDELIATHSDLAYRRVLESNLRLRFETPPIFIEPPSVLVEAGSLALGLGGTIVMYFGGTVPGMLMAVASPLASMVLRERAIKEARAHCKERIPDALDAAQHALTTSLERVIDRYMHALGGHISLARDDLGQQLQTVLQHAREAQAAASDAPSAGQASDGSFVKPSHQKRQLLNEATRCRTEVADIAAALHALTEGPVSSVSATEPRTLH